MPEVEVKSIKPSESEAYTANRGTFIGPSNSYDSFTYTLILRSMQIMTIARLLKPLVARRTRFRLCELR